MPEPYVRFLCERYPQWVEEMPTPFEIPQVKVDPDGLLEVAGWLREDGFDLLLDVGGVDYLPRRPRFEVVYHLLDTAALRRIRFASARRTTRNPRCPPSRPCGLRPPPRSGKFTTCSESSLRAIRT